MRNVILSMNMSLDGFVAGPNDEMDWLPPFNDDDLRKDIHAEMWETLGSVDAFLLGRGKPLFVGLENRARLRLVGLRTFRPEVAALFYRRL